MMIAASEPQEFIPFGRQQMLNHSKALHPGDNKHQLDSTLLNRLSQVVITDSGKSKESWVLRSTYKQDAECEEELYVNDKTVVWSVGPASVDSRTNRVLKCCYTSETVVQEALWCNFHLSCPDFPATFFCSAPSSTAKNIIDDPQDSKNLKNCICILNSAVLKTFTPTGQEYITSLQFQVQKLWAIKYGLLLERRVNAEPVANPVVVKKKPATDLRRQSIEQSFLQKGSFTSAPFWSFHGQDPFTPTESASDLPTLFSLSHPLDEICPVTSKNETSNYVLNPDLKIIFTSESPSLCLTTDRKTGLKAVYVIRKATPQESEMCGRRESKPSRRNSYSSVSKLSGSTNNSFVLEPPFLSLRTRKSLGLGTTALPTLASSPFNSFDGRTSSPLPSRTSPFPGCSPYTPRRGESAHSSFSGTSSRIEHRMLSEDVEHSEAKPLYPQICLQCVWADPDHKMLDSGNEVSKAFISTDILGQKYLYYLVQLKLHLLKLEVRSDEDFSLVKEGGFLHAKDAAPLESRNMIAVISLDGGVEVYSGSVHVAKILISGVSSSIATSSYLSDFNAGPTFFSKPSPGAFPKRSSLIPQFMPLESPVFNESLSQFSPVTTCSSLSPTLPTEREGALVALKDSVAGRISLEYSSSLLFRLELPNFGNSPLVESIINTLKTVLPGKTILQFLIKWYANRNAPGSYNVCIKEEFDMFIHLLYTSLGYDLETVLGDQMDPTSPVARPKKQRTSDLQSDEDWHWLIGSQHHKTSSKRLPPLNLPAMHLRANDMPVNPEITDTPLVSGRSTHKSIKSSSTPSKRPLKNVPSHSIDETPMAPKTSFGKTRSMRFQHSLEGVEEVPIEPKTSVIFNQKALLYPHFQSILYALHLLYEDLKLNILRSCEQEQLAPVLFQMAKDVGCESFAHHYWADYPDACRLVAVAPQATIENCLSEPVPSIFQQLNDILLKKSDIRPYPYLKGVNERSKIITEAFGLMSYGTEADDIVFKRMTKVLKDESARSEIPAQNHEAARVALFLSKNGFTIDNLQTLPVGVTLTLKEALYRCRENPGTNWSPETYELIERPELASLLRAPSDTPHGFVPQLLNERMKTDLDDPDPCELDDDGMEEFRAMDVLKLRWGADQRVIELRRMLQSAFPVRINIQQRPEVSDHEFQQEQERYLYAISTRTMALPVGRGMVTIGCGLPVVSEKLTIPQMCLAGKVPPADKLVDMSHIEIPANMSDWPLFHNGVAAGLRIPPNAPDIDSQWIIYNKPKSNLEEQIEHAGFLMALGLNGHLKDLMDLTIFMYLVKGHEMTRVGLMLGLAVSKRGTMDIHTVKVVSVHIEAMLPPTGIELDLDVIVEPAALISLGFLYQGTAHRHISQVLLQEIGRPPGPEMENSVDRESYSLAAGLALGLVVFGRGNTLSGLADMTIPDTLHHFMVGGPRRPYLGSQRDKYKNASFLISEGPLVNTHVTGPGATLALGMLYFNTGNKAVAEWLKIPETQHLLESVLPDALLLRTLAKALILWSEIEPTKEWILSNVPQFVFPHCLVKPSPEDDTSVDYETMNQAYCNIVAGACMAVGLKYAGTAHEDARDVLLDYAVKFTHLLGKSLAEICGKATVETCLNVMTVSLGMVMAGTGALEVIRLCRHLRSRVGPNNASVTYGSHLATHMTLGLLFLGGGSLTLSTSPEAIAALLCAFYPKWPVCSSDNRYHLQALRHLYVLAVEPRLLLPRDIETRTYCYAHITCLFIDGSIYKEKEREFFAPCLLPELNELKEVRIEDHRYWTIVFKRDQNWKDLQKILAGGNCIDVKRRAGFHTYFEDPQGYQSLITQTPAINGIIPWSIRLLQPREILLYSADPIFETFVTFFYDNQRMDLIGEVERKTLLMMSHFTYFCLTSDKLMLLPCWLSLIKLAQGLSANPTTNAVWQWKIVFSQSERSDYQLMPPEIPLAIKQDLKSLFTSWEPGVLVDVANYLKGNFNGRGLDQERIAAYLTFHEIPYRGSANIQSIFTGNNLSALDTLNNQVSATAMLAALSLLEV